MKHKDICELGNYKIRLGNDIIDFLISRVYLAYPEYYGSEIHTVRSYDSGSVMSVMASGSGFQKLAKDFLQPLPGVEVHEVKEIMKHSVFVRLICAAWQNLRGLDEYVVDNVTSIDVFQQLGNNECGHLCIHNIMLYLKVRKQISFSP